MLAAAIAVYVAYQQWRLAADRLRFDLYIRRFSVFDAVFDMYWASLKWTGAEAQTVIRDRFIKAHHESAFLFGGDDQIAGLLADLRKGIDLATGFRETKDLQDPDYAKVMQREVTNFELVKFEAIFLELKIALKPYLMFGAPRL